MAFSKRLSDAGHPPGRGDQGQGPPGEDGRRQTVTRIDLETVGEVPGIEEAEFLKLAESAKAELPDLPAAGAGRRRSPSRPAGLIPDSARPLSDLLRAAGGGGPGRGGGGAGLRDNGRVPVEMSRERFEELVGEALDEVPDELLKLMDNVVILVEDESPEGDDLLGLYEGHALTERGLALRRCAARPDHHLPQADAADLRDRRGSRRRGGGRPWCTRSPTTSASTTSACTSSAGPERLGRAGQVRSPARMRARPLRRCRRSRGRSGPAAPAPVARLRRRSDRPAVVGRSRGTAPRRRCGAGPAAPRPPGPRPRARCSRGRTRTGRAVRRWGGTRSGSG